MSLMLFTMGSKNEINIFPWRFLLTYLFSISLHISQIFCKAVLKGLDDFYGHLVLNFDNTTTVIYRWFHVIAIWSWIFICVTINTSLCPRYYDSLKVIDLPKLDYNHVFHMISVWCSMVGQKLQIRAYKIWPALEG